MYLRFVSPLRSRERHFNYGIFQAAYDCRNNERNPDFLRDAIREELWWFCEHLDAPDEWEFEVRAHRQRLAIGLCWFRAEAREMISHAYALRALVAECGMFITTLQTRQPGVILYEDRHQIVARPLRSTPTAWG